MTSETASRLANISQFMATLNFHDVPSFHRWTVTHYQDFWQRITKQLNIQFKQQPDAVCDLSAGIESPRWFPHGLLNITDSCFNAKRSNTALIVSEPDQTLRHWTFDELNKLVNAIANSLVHAGFYPGDRLAIAMPMHAHAIAIYLGIIKMGGVVVSIADSFSSQEIAVRLSLTKSKALFTQDYLVRGNKNYPLYEKVQQANAPRTVVLPYNLSKESDVTLRPQDRSWQDFFVNNTIFNSVACDPMAACNILFSSGTTGEPKAIVWNHTTAIKAASDAFFHQNIKAGDVLAWPTNLGWMMGPWLIYAAFINQAAIALYTDAPKDRAFGEFVQDAHVTMLGVVPTLVATWRQTRCMEGLDWSHINVFSSTGECSNPDDMSYLMSLAGNKPIIEYCGGTEIGGAYVSSTVIQENLPSQFSTPTMGLDFVILDEEGHPADTGEVAIIPPSIGLSTVLLNANHSQVYFDKMPTTNNDVRLRRHGDQIKRLPNGYYSIQGRVDDTMNLGGIKTSSAEIERVLNGLPSIIEVAAIAISPPENGPSQLVIFAASTEAPDKQTTIQEMQKRINTQINPLFKIHDVVFIKELPKTASNKIMRRVLRKEYVARS